MRVIQICYEIFLPIRLIKMKQKKYNIQCHQKLNKYLFSCSTVRSINWNNYWTIHNLKKFHDYLETGIVKL